MNSVKLLGQLGFLFVSILTVRFWNSLERINRTGIKHGNINTTEDRVGLAYATETTFPIMHRAHQPSEKIGRT